MIFAVLLPALW